MRYKPSYRRRRRYSQSKRGDGTARAILKAGRIGWKTAKFGYKNARRAYRIGKFAAKLTYRFGRGLYRAVRSRG